MIVLFKNKRTALRKIRRSKHDFDLAQPAIPRHMQFGAHSKVEQTLVKSQFTQSGECLYQLGEKAVYLTRFQPFRC